MRNCLVICNPADVESLSSKLGKGTAVTVTTDQAGLDALTGKGVTAFDGVVVVAELLWQGHSPSDFYGIDVAVTLRLNLKILAPLCILSFMPKAFFALQTETKFNILKARGTVFRKMPLMDSVGDAMGEVLPLSEATLAYLSNLLVDVQHMIDTFRHVLRFTSDSDRVASALKKLEVLSSLGIYPRAVQLSHGVMEARRDGDETRFYQCAGELLELLAAYLQQSGRAAAPEDEGRQKVVLVDDNPDDLRWAASALGSSFEVVAFQDVTEARRYIDADSGNEIAAVICDWQLLRPGTEEHQEMLGFELLEYAAGKGHYALFSLTSTDDISTLEVDQYLWFENTLITKDFRHDDALWRMYIPIIRQRIERNRAVIASIPTGEAWTSDFKLSYRKEGGKNVAFKQYYTSLKEQYIRARNSEDWHAFEGEISSLSDRLWQYYRKAMTPGERPFLFDLKTQWGLELNRDLRNVLVIRRLFLAFWFNKTRLGISFTVPGRGVIEDPVINIYSVLRHRYFREEMEERIDDDPARVYKDLNNAAKVFASQLAIEPAQLPRGILPEERAWLAGLGITVEGGNDNLY